MNHPAAMRALQLQSVGQLVPVELPVPSPGPDELLVRTVATTICTSDLNDLAHNPFGIALPRVLGHEGAGIVVELGAGVQGFRCGQRVAAHPVIPCRDCENCGRGLGHLCTRMGHLGLDRDGTFAEFFRIRADRVRCVPPGLATETAALLEPMAVCLEAVQRGRVGCGEKVVVVGDGPFGIVIARLVSRCRPKMIVLVGRHEFRLRQVPEALAINERTMPDVPERIRAATGGGADVAIMAAGTQSALDLCAGSLRARGRLVVFSALPGRASIDLFRLHTQELEILGACNDQDLIDPALACLADPALRLNSLVTHRVPFVAWPRAFELARGGKDEALKVALVFPETT
jgi:threonine dehydrogenase-like Zn-dependent dehydrogenase